MDRNSIIGFVLLAAILFGYTWYSTPTAEEAARMQRQQDSLAAVELEQRADQADEGGGVGEDPHDADAAFDLQRRQQLLVCGSNGGRERCTPFFKQRTLMTLSFEDLFLLWYLLVYWNTCCGVPCVALLGRAR